MLLLPLNGGWGNKGCTYSQSLEETKMLLDCDTGLPGMGQSRCDRDYAACIYICEYFKEYMK